MEGSAYSLTGSATLMSASGSVVCQWEVPQVHVYTSYLTVWSAVSTGGHSEAAVNLSSGCPAALERHVLPPYLSGADVQKGSSWRQLELRVEGPSGPWYSGTAELKSYRRSRWSGGSSEASTATVPALNPTTATWSP